jgi:redox-sensitive bicupin YhaK (pirin superfamily)
MLNLPEGHTAMIAVLSGRVTINDSQAAGEAEIVRFERDGSQVKLHADADTMLLVLTGQPLGEPVFGYGPFVMTSEEEIRQAIADFNGGRFGQVPA